METNEIHTRAEISSKSRKEASRFIREMEPLIRSVSLRYSEKPTFSPYRDDIFTAAEEGMYKALGSFDFSRRGFVQYARKAMEMEIRLFLSNETRLIRLPRYVTQAQRKIDGAGRENGTREEIMKAAGIKSEKTYRGITEALKYSPVSSLDRTVRDSDTPLSAFIPAEGNVEDEVMESLTSEEIRKALSSLSPSDRFIITSTFGLGGVKKRKSSEIAMMLSVTSTTVNNRRRKALESMRGALLPLVT